MIWRSGAIRKISIHAPTRGATQELSGCQDINLYFNPRSYKRSDVSGLRLYVSHDISIHAPTRGATLSPLNATKSV